MVSQAFNSVTHSASEFINDAYDKQIAKKWISFLDLLSKYRDVNNSLEDFLRKLQTMRARQVCFKGRCAHELSLTVD